MAIGWNISRSILDRIAAAAKAEPTREVCGLLFGCAGTIDAASACRNVAADPATRFEIDPAALLAAHRATRAGGAAIVGCYHSHPTGLAEPSLRDAADAAVDGGIWLIAAGDAVTAWLAVAHGSVHGRFVPVALHADPRAAK